MPDKNNSSILLMPGFDGTGELFNPLQEVLGIDATVVRYRDEYVFDDYVESVASLLPAENAILIAESFSGPVALALMAKYPARIKCAVLCVTFAISPFRLFANLSRFVPPIFFGPNPAQKAMVEMFCLGEDGDPELVSKALAVIRSVPAETIKSRLEVLADVDMRPLLGGITTPTLYIQALQDEIVSPELSQEVVQELPNCDLCKISGPHLLLQSKPKECAKAIRSFIDY